ncbi:MAG TPA: hypothetical protein VFP84_19415, partial [Kofleriaceae bacterium]|nr:hypothetical protein [Kofleriaceae bacterium]
IEAARRAELTTGPVPIVPAPVLPVVAASEPAVMTAPRRTTGPMAVAKELVIPPLAPEPARRPRRSMSELIESASGPIASVAGSELELDGNVDVAAVIARARALAGDGAGLDAELEALIGGAAAPVAGAIDAGAIDAGVIDAGSIDAVSAALARQLGGTAVRKDRGEGWAPPPATIAAESEAVAAVIEPVATEPEPARGIEQLEPPSVAHVEPAAAVATEPAVSEPAASEPAASESAASQPAASEPAASEPAAAAESIELDAEELDAAPARSSAPPHVEHVSTEPVATIEPIHTLSELDLEDAEHTEMGGAPVDPKLAEPEPALEPAPDDDLSSASSLGISVEAVSALHAAAPDEPAPRREDSGAEPLDLSLDEFDDFEIIAEASADDEDLLAAHGEREVSQSGAPLRAQTATGDEVVGEIDAAPIERPSDADFASRLALDDDDDPYDGLYAPSAKRAPHDVFDGGHADPLLDSAGHALAAFDTSDEPLDDPAPPRRSRHPSGDERRIVQPIFDPEPSSSYTLAGIPPSSELDLGPAIRDRAAPRPTKLPPPSRERVPTASLPPLYGGPVEDDELENALEALDVELDDLAIPQAPPARRPPMPTGRKLRPITDDGLEIDLEDE